MLDKSHNNEDYIEKEDHFENGSNDEQNISINTLFKRNSSLSAIDVHYSLNSNQNLI